MPAWLECLKLLTGGRPPEGGNVISIDRATTISLARMAHPEMALPKQIASLNRLTLAVREHELPIWRLDFADAKHSSYYVSGTTGERLERRNETWRWWDFFWMLHDMDYANRTSFCPLWVESGRARPRRAKSPRPRTLGPFAAIGSGAMIATPRHPC